MIEIHHVRGDQALRQAYNRLYVDRPIRHSDSFYLWILGLIRPATGQRYLDVACGQGRLVELAAARGLYALGTDLALSAVQASPEASRRLLACNGEALPFPDGAFDRLTNIGSLEHYVDPVKGLREMARVLHPDGRACLLLPNTYSLFANMLSALHQGRTSDDGQPIQRYAARYEWQDLIESHGLRVLETHKYECEWPLSWTDWQAYLRRPKALVRLLLTPLLPLNWANSFVYICGRHPSRLPGSGWADA